MTTASFRSPLAGFALALLLAAPATATPAVPAPATGAGAAKRAPAKPRPATAPAAAASRRLEDVHIEGELEVPRVTFITVRQPHRFTDFTRPTSVRSSRRLADDATYPAWISTAAKPAPDARKENRK
jgi:hypothetical protein